VSIFLSTNKMLQLATRRANSYFFAGLHGHAGAVAARLVRLGHSVGVWTPQGCGSQYVARGHIDEHMPDAVVLAFESAYDTAKHCREFLAKMPENTLVLDSGTDSPVDTNAVADMVQSFGHRYVDFAPQGTTAQMEQGSAVAAAGGVHTDVKLARRLFGECFAHIYHSGRIGAAHRAKAVSDAAAAAHAALDLELMDLAVEDDDLLGYPSEASDLNIQRALAFARERCQGRMLREAHASVSARYPTNPFRQ
jgi:3-hydroxyisobutyrate dehydrogenase-like beta-hydroxyacid dehydrogenase